MSSPRLSVILVVHRQQGYVRECVTAILEQSLRDVEVIAVDNASPDHGPEILDELAASDKRLVVHHLERPVGLGEARNVALDSATGDYVWFLATTDRLTPGSLAAVAARLDTAPDVLLVDHVGARTLGGTEPGAHGRVILGAPDSDSFTLREYPTAAELGTGVRDLIFKRTFLAEHGLRFAPGAHGHLGVTYGALLLAERIRVVPRSCSIRRHLRGAGGEPEVYGSPFDVFRQYEAVYGFVDSHGDGLAPLRGSLALPMLRDYLAGLRGLPDQRRKEFFARMSESYRRHTGEDAPVPASRRLRLEARFVAGGRYAPFRALEWADARRKAARRRLGAARRLGCRLWSLVRRKTMWLYYRLQLRAPLDPDLAVFASYWYAGCNCNPRALYEKLRELAPRIRGVWVVDAEHASVVPSGVEHVIAETRAYYRLIAQATYFVNNVNFPNEFVKREGTVHVQTHHGTPLKTMGLDLRSAFVAGTRMDFERLLRRSARWDYSISSNAFSTIVWERAYPVQFETLEVGFPRNDALVNATEADIERIRDELGIAPGRRTVLFAPTHREYLRKYVPTADLSRLADQLGPEYLIMPRVHYFYEDDLELERWSGAGRILDVTRHPSVEDLCLAADVLVTDYSSIMFDYAVLDRPIVIHAPDWDVYRTLRGTYFDLLSEPPGVVTSTDEELVAAFQSGAVWSEHAAELRSAFRARFASLDDGRASERVVRRVWPSETGNGTGAVERVETASARVEQ